MILNWENKIMSDFALHRYFKPSEPVPHMDQNTGMMDHFGELNSSVLEGFNVTDCSAGSFIGYNHQLLENPFVSSHSILGTSHSYHSRHYQVPTIDLTGVDSDENKWKVTEPSESSSEDVCSAVRENQTKDNNKSGLEKEKKRRCKRKGQNKNKPEEIIHVRAKRGQATDTHSLAERVRRERINNKLRFLQDLVPGCQKTMGLVTMLDEIISYVNSLKNQVEFSFSPWSLKLLALISRAETKEETGSHEEQEIEKWVREQYRE